MFYLHGWLGFSFIFFKIIIGLMIIFLLLLFSHFNALADDEFLVTEEDGIYQVTVSARISAAEMYVRQVITDYVHAYRINDSIIESEVFESSVSGNIRVRVRLLSCVRLFCLEAERVDEVSTLESGDILAVIVPEKSDFLSGRALWKIIPDGDSTQLIYRASFEPSFFIPPIFGARLFMDILREQLVATFLRIEQVAQIKQEREWDENRGVKNGN